MNKEQTQRDNRAKNAQEKEQNSKKGQVRAVFSLSPRSGGRLNLNRQLRDRQISQKSGGAAPGFGQEKRRGRPRQGAQGSSEYEEKLIKLARVVKVVKGGRRFSFTAYVVVGNKRGKIGLGHGNANEVQDAIKKAVKDGIKNIIEVPIVKSSVPHEVVTKFLATRVLIKPAPIGRGLVAAGVARTVVELAGYVNITTKIYGSRSPQNVALAMLKALGEMKTKKQIQFLRFGSKEQQRTPQRVAQ